MQMYVIPRLWPICRLCHNCALEYPQSEAICTLFLQAFLEIEGERMYPCILWGLSICTRSIRGDSYYSIFGGTCVRMRAFFLSLGLVWADACFKLLR